MDLAFGAVHDPFAGPGRDRTAEFVQLAAIGHHRALGEFDQCRRRSGWEMERAARRIPGAAGKPYRLVVEHVAHQVKVVDRHIGQQRIRHVPIAIALARPVTAEIDRHHVDRHRTYCGADQLGGAMIGAGWWR